MKRNADDDGRTIVNMNVDGMPWYREGNDQNDPPGQDGNENRTIYKKNREPLTKEQQRMYTWAAVKAGLFVVLVFGVVFFLFIAFCDFIWFQ